MEHSSTLDPRGTTGSFVRPVPLSKEASKRGPVKVLMLAPFQYTYGSRSYWVGTGDWQLLDPVRDREEILYLDSPSNPYRQFMYMEGHEGIAGQEEKGEIYSYGTDYKDLVSDPPPPLRSNALLAPEEPADNPHIMETLARAGLSQPLTTRPLLGSDMEEVVPPVPTDEGDLPRYESPLVPEEPVQVAPVVDGIEFIPTPTSYELREAELRTMKVPALKGLATTLGIEYKDKESTIKQILDTE